MLTAGIDTWSPCWYVERETSAAAHLGELAIVPSKRGRLLEGRFCGHRVGWNEGVGLLYAEGHPLEGRLCPPDALPSRLSDLVLAMLEGGVPVPGRVAEDELAEGPGGTWSAGRYGFAGVRRLDATVDVPQETREAGLGILAGVAAVATTFPRMNAEVWYAKDGSGSVETVRLRAGRSVAGRWYDKSQEQLGRRGLLLRAEDQHRYVKGSRRDVTELSSSYVRAQFVRRFEPLWSASKGVVVTGSDAVVKKLVQLGNEGVLTEGQVHDLAGFLVTEPLGHVVKRDMRCRRRRTLREHGLVSVEGMTPELELDLEQLLEEVLDGASWGQG